MRSVLLGLVVWLALTAPAAAQLPAEIPLFPLGEPVLFPEATRPLLIFEPRYREMVADALKGDRIIGMATLRPGYEKDYEGRPPIYEIGCAGEIISAEQFSDGRYMIVLRAIAKFRVTGEDQSRAYRIGRVQPIPEPMPPGELAALSTARERLATLLFTELPPGVDPPDPSLGDAEYINLTVQYLTLSPEERQTLLEAPGPLERARRLIALLQR